MIGNRLENNIPGYTGYEVFIKKQIHPRKRNPRRHFIA